MPPKTRATAEQVAAERVDLDLDVLRPRGGTFRHLGKVYYVPAEIPIPVMVEAMQADEHGPELEARAQKGDEAALREIRENYDRQYRIVMDLLRSVNPELGEDGLLLTQGEVTMLLGLMASGGRSPGDGVREQVVEAVLGGGAEIPEGEEDEEEPVSELPPTRAKRASGKSAGGRSGARSRSKSSG